MNLDGSYSNEFEAAYDLSRMEYDPADELDLILGHVDAGKYVVVAQVEVCCKFTDALLGVEVVPPGYPPIFEMLPDLDSFYRDWLGQPLPDESPDWFADKTLDKPIGWAKEG